MNEVDEYLQLWAMEAHIALITKVCANLKQFQTIIFTSITIQLACDSILIQEIFVALILVFPLIKTHFRCWSIIHSRCLYKI